MGCSNSKVDNEEGLAICKQRKRLMKQTVISRHSLAASHALYVISLKGVGAAFRQFAEGDMKGDGDSHSLYSTTETNTPRTPPTKPGAPINFSAAPLSPQTRLSALRLRPGLAKSVTLDFLPPPPPITVNAMEHTPPVIPTKIYRSEDSNSYMKSFRMEDDSRTPPFVQSFHEDDDWRYSGMRSTEHMRGLNAPPPPPPPVARSIWQDLFFDPFRPGPVSYNYMDERRSVDLEEREIERRKRYEHEMMLKRKQEAEVQERRAREMELKRMHEMATHHRPPPVKIGDFRSVPFDHRVPDLEDDEIPELEDVDEDVDGPPPPVFVENIVKELPPRAPTPMPTTPPPKPTPMPEPKLEPRLEVESTILPPLVQLQQPEFENKQVPKPEALVKSPPPPPPKIVEPLPPPSPPKVVELPPPPPPSAKVVEPPTPSSPAKVVEPPTPPLPAKVVEPPPPPSPKVVKAAKTPPGKPPKPSPTFTKTNKTLAMAVTEPSGRDLLDVVKEVDDCFLKAAQCGESVSRMLETRKPHYHSSLSDGLRVVGESARMNFWKLSGKSGSTSFRTSSNISSISNMSALADDSPNIMSMRRSLSNMSSQRFTEECGLTSHAASLERLFAWEKKLYLEVKQAEALKVDLERKFAIFRSQDQKNEDHDVIDKTKRAIKTIQTRMVVAIQAVDNGYQQVQKLRDEELYPQLLELLDGIGAMWKEMIMCHKAQLKAVEAIGRIENSAAFESTTSSHRQATSHLELALTKWSEALSRSVHSQREHLKNLTSWLRLSLMQLGSDEVDDKRIGSRSPSQSPRSPFYNVGPSPIYELCQQWQDLLGHVVDNMATEAIATFVGAVREMLKFQGEELRMKKRVETCERELERRGQSLHAAISRDANPGSGPGHGPPSRSPTTTSGSDMDDHKLDIMLINQGKGSGVGSEVAEKRMKYEATQRKLEDGREAVRKAARDTRTYTLNSMQNGLPQLFRAVIGFVDMEVDVYDKLNK